MTRFDPEQFPSVSDFFIEDEEETATCREMADEARTYIKRFKWRESIGRILVGFCYPGIVAAFAFRVGSSNPTVPPWVWVVVGDLPPAYFDAEEATTPADALRRYIGIMGRWIDAVRGKEPFDENVAPVDVPRTEEWAANLEKRLDFLEREIVPELSESA